MRIKSGEHKYGFLLFLAIFLIAKPISLFAKYDKYSDYIKNGFIIKQLNPEVVDKIVFHKPIKAQEHIIYRVDIYIFALFWNLEDTCEEKSSNSESFDSVKICKKDNTYEYYYKCSRNVLLDKERLIMVFNGLKHDKYIYSIDDMISDIFPLMERLEYLHLIAGGSSNPEDHFVKSCDETLNIESCENFNYKEHKPYFFKLLPLNDVKYLLYIPSISLSDNLYKKEAA